MDKIITIIFIVLLCLGAVYLGRYAYREYTDPGFRQQQIHRGEEPYPGSNPPWE